MTMNQLTLNILSQSLLGWGIICKPPANQLRGANNNGIALFYLTTSQLLHSALHEEKITSDTGALHVAPAYQLQAWDKPAYSMQPV